MRRVALALFGTIAGLVGLLSFKTHPASVASPPAAVSTTGSGSDSSASAGSGSSTTTGQSAQQSTSSASTNKSSATSGASSSSASATKTVTGTAVDTRYGPVQVRITVRNGKVLSASAIQYPSQDPRDAQINSYAIPVLEKESVGVSSPNIDMVSGATYTSEGYAQSLQSALDQAGI